MTVPYNRSVASASSWSSIKILLRWRGSIWKSVLPEYCAWMCVYYFLFCLLYNLNFDNSKEFYKHYAGNWFMQKWLKDNDTIIGDFVVLSISRSFDNDYSVPLVMLLSFFSAKAFERWQYIFNNLAYAENLALTVNAFIKGSDRIAQLARQTIMRQAILAQILIYRDVSISVRKRFPTMESLVEADMLKPDELKMLESSYNQYNVFTIPFCWISTLLTKLRQDGNITGEPTYVNLFTEIKDFRKKLETVFNYDCVPIPLAYPQIVSIAVRLHCIVTIIGKLFIFSRTEPVWKLNSNFGAVCGPELLLFLAWLKVAEILANPLGEDDDDLELNHIIDRNNFISRSIIDTHDQCPILEETDLSANLKYDEHAKQLGGSNHRLMGSASKSKVEIGRMVEVAPTRKPEIRKRGCCIPISNILGKDADMSRSGSTIAIVEHGDMGSTASIPDIFCVKVPSLYDSRPLRGLTEEEMDIRFPSRQKKMTSLMDFSDPSPLSAASLVNEKNEHDVTRY